MDVQIDINTDRCIVCGKCVKVCPAKIFSQNAAADPIQITNSQSCIVCGHCVAVCPEGAVLHSDFPVERVHKIDYSQMPTSEQFMVLCRSRRSNRAFSTKPIPTQKFDMILEAAHRAPTASNSQSVSFMVVTDPEKIQTIIDCTMAVFMELLKKLNNPFVKPIIKLLSPDTLRYIPLFERLKREYANGNDPILRKATAVILINSPKKNALGSVDANLAYQNGSLMAECLEVSQFYMGFVLMAIKQDKTHRLANKLGIEGYIHAGMALGMPQFRFPNYVDRKDIVVEKY